MTESERGRERKREDKVGWACTGMLIALRGSARAGQTVYFGNFYFVSSTRALLSPFFQIMAGRTASKKSDLKPSKGRSIRGKQPVEAIEPALSNDGSESDTSETVDDEGMENLMEALGEDGLNEFDLAQLHTLAGAAAGFKEGDEEDERSGDETEDEEQGGEEDGEGSGEEDIALDDEDVDSVDEDAVPRRKIAIDNTVRHSLSSTRYFI